MAKHALNIKEDLSIIKSRNIPLQNNWLNDDEWKKIEASIYFYYNNLIKFMIYLLIVKFFNF